MILYISRVKFEVETGRPECARVELDVDSTQDSRIGEDQMNE